MKSIDSQRMRSENRKILLKLLWEHREVSRAELSRLTGMSRSAVSEIVSELLSYGLVTEIGSGESCGGRKPIILQFNDDGYYTIGVEIGASHLEIVLSNLRGKLLAQETIEVDIDEKPHETLEIASATIRQWMKSKPFRQIKLLGMGVALASPVDPHAEYIGMAAEIRPAWAGIDLQKYFSDQIQVPVFVDNDANLGALAELWWGQHTNTDSLVFIKMGTGFGAGFVVHGKIHAGSLGLAGEIGHMVIDRRDSTSLKGLPGCLAAYAGSSAIIQYAKNNLSLYPESVLHHHKVTIDRIVQASQIQDPLAIKLIADIGRTIGIGIANLINLINPSAIILGGRFAEAGRGLHDAIAYELQRRVLWPKLAKTSIVTTSMSSQAIAIGAATQVIDRLLNGQYLELNAGFDSSSQRRSVNPELIEILPAMNWQERPPL